MSDKMTVEEGLCEIQERFPKGNACILYYGNRVAAGLELKHFGNIWGHGGTVKAAVEALIEQERERPGRKEVIQKKIEELTKELADL